MTGKQILLLEKEKGLARILTLLLRQAGFEVTCCNRTETALAAILTDQVDLLIIDVPGGNCEGNQLLQSIADRDIVLPLIILTPYGSKGAIRELAGINEPHILHTPFEPADLLICINETTTGSN